LYKIHFLLNNLKKKNLKEKKSTNQSDKKKDQDKLIKYFENLKEIYSQDDINSNIILIKIKTLNGFEANDFVLLRLYGLEGKSKQIKLTNNKKSLDEFEFKCCYIGQLIGLSFQWIHNESNEWTLEYTEINDLENNISIKYVPNKYWIKLTTNNEAFMLITNKSYDKINEYSKLINSLNKNHETLFTKEKDFKKIILIIRMFDSSIYTNLSKDLQLKFQKFALNYLEFVIKKLNDLKILIYFTLFKSFLISMISLTDESENFCLSFYEKNRTGFKILFDIINLFISKEYYAHQNELIELILGLLHNLSRFSCNYIDVWQDKLNVLQDLSSNPSAKILCFTIISNIATDDELKRISKENTEIIESIVNKVSTLANMSKDKNCKRTNDGWHLLELMNALFSFSKSDEIKFILYNDFKMNNILRTIIYNGNKIEQESAFKLLYQLCFDEHIAKDILNDQRLFDLIKQESNNNKNCKGIQMVIDNKFNKKSNINQNNKHIMISYNSKSRDYCLQIKNELENIGKKVWIDIDNITGSSLEAMAKAIEQSECVLVCMTEMYKESPNCRLEAEYIIQLNKPFVPIIMQKGYKPNGWLGIILGSKIFIDINKHNSVKECFEKILQQINAVTEYNLVSIKKDIVIDINKKFPIAASWSQSQVLDWMNEKKFSIYLNQKLDTYNGELLFHLFNIYNKNPEFFYQQISKESNDNVNFFDIVKFTFELEKLFV
jgi:hypothetical protein